MKADSRIRPMTSVLAPARPQSIRPANGQTELSGEDQWRDGQSDNARLPLRRDRFPLRQEYLGSTHIRGNQNQNGELQIVEQFEGVQAMGDIAGIAVKKAGSRADSRRDIPAMQLDTVLCHEFHRFEFHAHTVGESGKLPGGQIWMVEQPGLVKIEYGKKKM